MRSRRCPQCGYVGQFLAEESRNAFVDYHYCHQCAELWVIDPMNPTKPPRVLHGGGANHTTSHMKTRGAIERPRCPHCSGEPLGRAVAITNGQRVLTYECATCHRQWTEQSREAPVRWGRY